ncbi:MAG: hypothetical protein ACXVHS_01160 [Methanobacterium sp.]
MERNKILKSLNELEEEFKKGNIPESHYELQKSRLDQKLEDLAVAERVMKLQGKKTEEAPVETSNESDNDELFKKYITSPGLKEKNIENKKKGISQNTMIATALLIIAFVVGISFGIYALDIPGEVSSVSLSTNDSAFPPYVNNTTNMTNTTNTTQQLVQTQQPTETTETQPTETTQQTTTPTDTQTTTTPTNTGNTNGSNGAAGEPNTKKTTRNTSPNTN